jgi:hypothetical protein
MTEKIVIQHGRRVATCKARSIRSKAGERGSSSGDGCKAKQAESKWRLVNASCNLTQLGGDETTKAPKQRIHRVVARDSKRLLGLRRHDAS